MKRTITAVVLIALGAAPALAQEAHDEHAEDAAPDVMGQFLL